MLYKTPFWITFPALAVVNIIHGRYDIALVMMTLAWIQVHIHYWVERRAK